MGCCCCKRRARFSSTDTDFGTNINPLEDTNTSNENWGTGSTASREIERVHRVPPASRSALASLSEIVVSLDDLIEESNKECLICLAEHEIGSRATKLPCGHLYHKPCLLQWLVLHAFCPACRYELETNDLEYEVDRKKRMQSRKFRLRRGELNTKTVKQLRALCSSLSVDIQGSIEKQDIIEKLENCGKIEFTEGVPSVPISQTEFNAKKVGELKTLLLSFGLSAEGAIEKYELREKLIESGRIIIIPDSVEG